MKYRVRGVLANQEQISCDFAAEKEAIKEARRFLTKAKTGSLYVEKYFKTNPGMLIPSHYECIWEACYMDGKIVVM